MIKHFEDKEEAIPSLDDILSLWDKTRNTHIKPSVTIYNQVKFNQLKICEIATPSDETFGLLLLENAWDRWSYQAANPDGETFPATKYSNEGSTTRIAKMYAGWKSSGLHRFNDLQRLVKGDRTTSDRLEFEMNYLIAQQANTSNKRQRISYGVTEYVSVDNDLDDDLED
jgi:hypothetical protein